MIERQRGKEKFHNFLDFPLCIHQHEERFSTGRTEEQQMQQPQHAQHPQQQQQQHQNRDSRN